MKLHVAPMIGAANNVAPGAMIPAVNPMAKSKIGALVRQATHMMMAAMDAVTGIGAPNKVSAAIVNAVIAKVNAASMFIMHRAILVRWPSGHSRSMRVDPLRAQRRPVVNARTMMLNTSTSVPSVQSRPN